MFLDLLSININNGKLELYTNNNVLTYLIHVRQSFIFEMSDWRTQLILFRSYFYLFIILSHGISALLYFVFGFNYILLLMYINTCTHASLYNSILTTTGTPDHMLWDQSLVYVGALSSFVQRIGSIFQYSSLFSRFMLISAPRYTHDIIPC